ncbi:phosphotransferase family protein [Erythrobacter sp. HL-111]|uniref:phosphotransferase family protein n=1 Tax=Erythrobacter sp. HL-111 TaxID=1798193 RepID=UPI0006DA4491|nr:phosphotransferase family protein [Erythrobacter sp. HL-111]KPP92613.1 MAG: putative aminoglycoside phosphotransferase [Erythrobacteraceae bacterium HL-111]SDS94459.1 Predicted kinase, aminoglycoside phosphotransferase (APT) family [Erythrobacter sp. HL-111]
MVDTEPRLAAMLEARKARRAMPPYIPQRDADIAALLESFFAREEPGATVSDVARIGGGASKEQFVFSLAGPDGETRRYVLRMDALEGITETSREREFEILTAFQGVVPVPRPIWLDAEPSHFPMPAIIMEFVAGVTKPRTDGVSVTGLGTVLGDPLRGMIAPQYFENLAAIHKFDWRAANLKHFAAPLDDPKQPTRWLIQFWKELLEQDAVTREPVLRLATQWLEDNVPDCPDPCVVHGDYRTGNYLFDEVTGQVTAILDWEMAYIGDFHADLGWLLQPVFGSSIDGVFRASDIAPPEEMIARYEAASGSAVDRAKLHYFTVFNAWKSYILVSALGMQAARSAHNHQDVLLTFLAATGPMFVDELARLLMMEESR